MGGAFTQCYTQPESQLSACLPCYLSCLPCYFEGKSLLLGICFYPVAVVLMILSPRLTPTCAILHSAERNSLLLRRQTLQN